MDVCDFHSLIFPPSVLWYAHWFPFVHSRSMIVLPVPVQKVRVTTGKLHLSTSIPHSMLLTQWAGRWSTALLSPLKFTTVRFVSPPVWCFIKPCSSSLLSSPLLFHRVKIIMRVVCVRKSEFESICLQYLRLAPILSRKLWQEFRCVVLHCSSSDCLWIAHRNEPSAW